MIKTTPYSIQKKRVELSPFRSVDHVKEVIQKYDNGINIGFTYTSSLKSMGLIPRSDGTYKLGAKYQH